MDFLSQQVKVLEASRAELTGAATDAKSQRDKLARTRDVAVSELGVVVARLSRAEGDLPAVTAQRATLDRLLAEARAGLEAARTEVAANEAAAKAAGAEVDRLTGVRTAVNARIADLKLKVAANQGAIADTFAAKAAASVDVDRLVDARRQKDAAVARARTALEAEKAALDRANARRARAEANLDVMRAQLATVLRVRKELTAALAPSPAPPRAGGNTGTGSKNAAAASKAPPPPLSSGLPKLADTALTAQVALLGASLQQRAADAAALSGRGN